MPPRSQAGLCDGCGHQRVVPNSRGSRFSLCELSWRDPAFAKYPRLPVVACLGYQPRSSASEEIRPLDG